LTESARFHFPCSIYHLYSEIHGDYENNDCVWAEERTGFHMGGLVQTKRPLFNNYVISLSAGEVELSNAGS
jgi:hypothetical protein